MAMNDFGRKQKNFSKPVILQFSESAAIIHPPNHTPSYLMAIAGIITCCLNTMRYFGQFYCRRRSGSILILLIFPFNGQNKKPVDVRLLDWQISRYSSPVLDLVYYIFCCTTKPIRDQCYDELIKTYHTSLSKMLTRFVHRLTFSSFLPFQWRYKYKSIFFILT